MNPTLLPLALAICTGFVAWATGGESSSQHEGQTLAYHVDATRGDDAYDGLTPETAWQSLGKVSGEVWRGQLVPQNGSADGPITYGAFGEGGKPLLLGSAALNRAEDWQPAGEGIWATAPIRYEPQEVHADLAAGWSLHREGGAECSLTPLPAEGGPENGAGYRLQCRSPGTRSNHLQLSVTGFTVREGEYYLFTYRARCSEPFTPASMVVMKSGSPWTRYASPAADLLEIGPQWAEHAVCFPAEQTAEDARLTLFLGGALPAGATLDWQPGKLERVVCNQAIPLSVDVGNIIFDGGPTVGVKKWRDEDLQQEGDYYYDARLWQVRLRSAANPATRYRSIELALRRHVINQGGRSYVTYKNLDLRYGAAHGIGGGGTRQIIVRDCPLILPDQGKAPAGRLWEIYDAALTNQGDGENIQENITYRRNVIWNCEYSFEYWNRTEASLTRNIRFEYNTCVDAGYGWGHGQRPDRNGRHVMFYNNSAATEQFLVVHNIFCNATDSCLRLHGRDWTDALTMDHNIWYQPQGPILLWQDQQVGPNELAAFQQTRGFDAHSLLADPQFVDPARRDYRLAPASPVRALQSPGRPAGALP
jgi:hypothetical protein